MTHDEFVKAVFEMDFTTQELARLATPTAILPLSWLDKILNALPNAEGYLRERCPSQMDELDKVIEKRKEIQNTGE